MTYETITVETDARGTKGVTLLTINRPQALNALNYQILADLFDAFARRLEEAGCQRSCAAGAVSLDLDEDAEAMRPSVEAAFACWREAIARRLVGMDRRRARSLAGLLLTAIEGAYIRGRAERSAQAFIEAGRWLAPLAAPEA